MVHLSACHCIACACASACACRSYEYFDLRVESSRPVTKYDQDIGQWDQDISADSCD